MRVPHFTLISAGLLLLAIPAFAVAGPKRTSSKMHSHASVKHTTSSVKHTSASVTHTSGRHKKTSRAASHHESAAVEMPAERATQIQSALIKQGYLTGEPSGAWDPQTISAMQKLQADNGWQSKVTPDSRALIKLGLGPDQPHDIAQTQPQ